jgi:hypothetical protein
MMIVVVMRMGVRRWRRMNINQQFLLRVLAIMALGTTVHSSTIIDVAAVVPPETISALLEACASGSFDPCYKKTREIIAEGWPAQQVGRALAVKLLPDC